MWVNHGAHFLDDQARVVKQVRFSRSTVAPVEVTRLDSDGDYGYLTQEESWVSPVILYDRHGQELWSYSQGLLSAVDDSVLLGTGFTARVNVAVRLNGTGGLVLVDAQGKQTWQKPEGNVWHVDVLDSANGNTEILHSDAQGQLLARDADGSIVARYLEGTYVSWFTVTRWEGSSHPDHILVPINQVRDGGVDPELLVLDARGETLARLEAPLGNLMQSVRGLPVSFAGKSYDYAVVMSRRASPRPMLLIYDKDGRIEYQEVLGERCLGIEALSGGKGDHLLLGCLNRVFEYSRAAADQTNNQVSP